MIEKVTNIKSHKDENERTEYTASKVELNMILASLKNGVDEIKIKILKYLRVLKSLEISSLAITKC
jgi:hypothetical protein